jgi:hypothetical protein
MLVLAAAATGEVGTGWNFATRSRRENLHDFRASVMSLALGDADSDVIAFRGEGNKNDETLLESGEAIPAKDHLFDGEIDEVAARG